MATIGTSIKLNDMMSAPIKSITNAMNMMLSSWESLDSATAGGLDVNGVESIRSELNNATRAIDQMGDEQQEFNHHVENGSRAMDGLTNQILGAVGAYVSLQSLGQLANLSDSFTQTTARLNMINDGAQTTDELFDKIAASADRSRASISATADAVAKLSLNAGDAFGSNDETILFAENLNKLFAIAGTEQQAVASATLQLTQALGSGVLRGEEFNAVFEAAPNIMQTVAKYMNVPIGQLRSMAQEGKITADVVKNALLSATGEINAQFESMPMTWGQVWTGVMNELYYASLPLLEFINLLANNWSVLQPIVMGVAAAIGLYTAALLIHNGVTAASALIKSVHAAAEMMAAGATFTATVAQHGFNAALLACPITWIILAIIAVIAIIYAVVAAINKIQGTTTSATGVILGVLTAAVSIIWNLFLTLLSLIIQSCLVPLTTAWDTFANFFGNIFNDPITTIIRMFEGLANTVLGILKTIANGIDAIFGSNLSGAVQGWMSKVSGKADELAAKYGNGTYEEKSNLTGKLQGLLSDAQTKFSWQTSDAYNTGYGWGESVDTAVGDLFGKNLADQYTMDGIGNVGEMPTYDKTNGTKLDDIAGSAGSINDSLQVTNEDLKYLRDIAEQEAINRFTTAEIRVDMGGINNTVNQNADLDGIIDYMVTGVQEAMERAAEGVHD
jgi:tape measure domain-containing protein